MACLIQFHLRSVGLLIQVALPCFIFSPGACRAVLKGGTDAEFAPPMDYLTEVINLDELVAKLLNFV